MNRAKCKKVYFVSLGCDKNLVDSEKALKLLSDEGYSYTPDPAEADVAVVNTCCFIRDALKESIETLIELSELKRLYGFKIVVMGCMGERYPDEIRKEFPEADVVCGVFSRQVSDRILSVPSHSAYLKIAEGCDRRCSYCAIPLMRGSYHSVPMDELTGEAALLAARGAKELVLVAQETTLYGTDLYGKKSLPLLLEKLNDIPGIEWIRVLYAYPEEIDNELINSLCQLKNVVKYIDIPIQSASDHILRRMGRKTRRAEIEELIGRLREKVPGIALRTTLISGFPGETPRDHEETLSFVRNMRFERLGVFTFSREPGTRAYSFSHRVSEKEKTRRREEIMLLQQEISLSFNRSLTGRTFRVLTEGRLPDEGGIYVGRTYMDAPDVDGLVYFSSERPLMTGDMVDVSVTGASQYDLTGHAV